MDKKEEFKAFIKGKPELIKYIRNKEATLQEFYEIYDTFGEDESAWSNYLNNDRGINPVKLTDIMKNINLDEIQKHINTAKKALGVVEDLTTKGTDSIKNSIKGPLKPRPLNKFFED